MLAWEMGAALRVDHHAGAAVMAQLVADGVAGWWPDPIGRMVARRRWWVLEHLPKRRPPPSQAPQSPSAQRCDLTRGPSPVAAVAAPAAAASAPAAAGRPVQPVPLPGWTHDPRYQVAPGAAVHGAGFAAAGVGRDVLTGLPWGAAAAPARKHKRGGRG